MSDALVSIISPCYNGEKYVSLYLQSILSQTYSNVELIFVDDGSTDNTKTIIESFKILFEEKGYSLKYYYQENGGQAKAINTGLKMVKGTYLMWVDSDDILYSNNIEVKVRYLEEHPECGLVMCKAHIVKEDAIDIIIGEMFRNSNLDNDNFFEDLLFDRNVVFNPCIYMARILAFDQAIPNRNIYESREGQNWQMLLPLAHMFQYGYIDEHLAKIVEHCDSHSRIKRSYEKQIKREIAIIQLLNKVITGMVDLNEEQKSQLLKRIGIYRWKKVWSTAKIGRQKEYISLAKKKLALLESGISFKDFYNLFLKQKYGNSKLGIHVRNIIKVKR